MSFASPNVNYLQGSAAAALTWVVYDAGLTLDREIIAVWRSAWSLSKVLFLFTRYHTILALGFFLMEAIGTEHFTLPLSTGTHQNLPASSSWFAPCIANLKYSLASRWYLGLTEVFSILAGELMILIRINAVYGWSRKVVVLTLFLFCAESVIGLVTTVLSILGGSSHLLGSTGILTCTPKQVNVPDVNISMWCTSMSVACIYLGLIVQKATDAVQVMEAADGHPRVQRLPLFAAFKTTQMTPTLHLCLRDAALYFIIIFGVLLLNLVLILEHNRYAQLGTPWLLATYSVTSARIFLNLKNMSLAHHLNTGPTWSEFQQSSALEFQTQSAQREMRETRSGSEVGRPQAHRRED